MNTGQKTKGDTYYQSTIQLRQFRLQNKVFRLALALLANALSTSSGIGQCSRRHCSKTGASSRSSVMVERIDVSVRCNLEKTRSDLDVVRGSVPRMVNSR